MTVEKMRRARKRSRFHLSRMVPKTIDMVASRISRKVSGVSGRKNIVLFRNGRFRAMKGHASAPRKRNVNAISSLVNI